MKRSLCFLLCLALLCLPIAACRKAPQVDPAHEEPLFKSADDPAFTPPKNVKVVASPDSPLFYVWRYDDELRYVLMGMIEKGKIIPWDLDMITVGGTPLSQYAASIVPDDENDPARVLAEHDYSLWNTAYHPELAVDFNVDALALGEEVEVFTGLGTIGVARVASVECFSVLEDEQFPSGLPQVAEGQLFGVYGTLDPLDEFMFDIMIYQACFAGKGGAVRAPRFYDYSQHSEEDFEAIGDFLNNGKEQTVTITTEMGEIGGVSYYYHPAVLAQAGKELGSAELNVYEYSKFGKLTFADLVGSGTQQMIWMHNYGLRVYNLTNKGIEPLPVGCITGMGEDSMLQLVPHSAGEVPLQAEGADGILRVLPGGDGTEYRILGGTRLNRFFSNDNYILLNNEPLQVRGNDEITYAYRSAQPMAASPGVVFSVPFVSEGQAYDIYAQSGKVGEGVVGSAPMFTYYDASASYTYGGILTGGQIEGSRGDLYIGVAKGVDALPRSVSAQAGGSDFALSADIDGDGTVERIVWDWSKERPITVTRGGETVDEVRFAYDPGYTEPEAMRLLDLDGDGTFELIISGTGRMPIMRIYQWSQEGSFRDTGMGYTMDSEGE